MKNLAEKAVNLREGITWIQILWSQQVPSPSGPSTALFSSQPLWWSRGWGEDRASVCSFSPQCEVHALRPPHPLLVWHPQSMIYQKQHKLLKERRVEHFPVSMGLKCKGEQQRACRSTSMDTGSCKTIPSWKRFPSSSSHLDNFTFSMQLQCFLLSHILICNPTKSFSLQSDTQQSNEQKTLTRKSSQRDAWIMIHVRIQIPVRALFQEHDVCRNEIRLEVQSEWKGKRSA